jgi:adenylate kinase family enzyme
MNIAFCGKMASGKTTLANQVVEIKGDAERVSFADAVKDFARFLYDIPEGHKDRIKFQKVGDGARRFISGDVWIEALLTKVGNSDKSVCILDDARYENELVRLKQEGWKVVLLDISDELQVQRLKETYPNDWKTHLSARTHPSESGIDYIDKTLFDLVIDARDGNDLVYDVLGGLYDSMVV